MKQLYIFLDSPYKWGKGWTGSHEAYTELHEASEVILCLLDFHLVENPYNVPEGKRPDSEEKAYMHPMEFVISCDTITPEKIVEVVRGQLPSFVTIREVQLIEKTHLGDANNTKYTLLNL
jgi:hypothetical protein